ncbi:MAG: C4-type zinc ribbon domain-containing protein [Mycobacteriales bacterium]
MNAQPEDQLRLLDLQAIDSAIDRLAHRRATLPELTQLAELTVRQEALGADVVRAQTEVGDLDREQRKLELDIEQVRGRADRDRQRMAVSTSPKEAEGLQHEVGSLARRQGDLEDQLLELMERREDAGKQLDAVTAQLDAADAAFEVATAGRDKASAEIDAGVLEQQVERQATAADLPADLLALYERIRESSGGTGAARLYRHRCEGCHLELSGGDLAAVRSAPADEVVRCEECRRILIRTPESGL